MPTVAYYISGHGFGHASRNIEVVNELLARTDEVAVHVRTSAPRWLFDLTARGPLQFTSALVDTGVAQRGSLHVDLDRTYADARAFYSRFDAVADAEAAWLAASGVDLVIADMPPVAFEAAHRAGVPSYGLGNFTWDWIYEHYDLGSAGLGWLPGLIVAAHGRARGAWRLPLHGGFAGFAQVVDVPLVARRSRRGKEEVRRALGIPTDRPVLLVSFGGFGVEGLPLEEVARAGGYTMVVAAPGAVQSPSPDVIALDEHALYEGGHRYEDLVRASDVVVSKPGYGIVSECAANRTALLYTSRGDFVEYGVLVNGMRGLVRSRFISNDDLLAGRWSGAVTALLAQPPPPPARTDGAEVVARALVEAIAEAR